MEYWDLEGVRLGEESPAAVRALASAGFADVSSALRALQRLGADPRQREVMAAFLPHLMISLSEAGGPDRVLASFERFIHSADDPLATCRLIAHQPRAVEILVKVFSGSQFLTEILLRNPEYFEQIVEPRRLALNKSVEQLVGEARAAVEPFDTLADQLDALRRFQRWELLRIGISDLLDLFDMKAATRQLSNLADSLVQTCLRLVTHQGREADDDNPNETCFTVIGMGKLGGQELNYSSDIDFLFLATPPSTQATRIGEKLIDALARVTTEGFLYRVDMRLRPWGKVGPLVSSPDGYLGYLSKHAMLWEKQALLKARVVAGDRRVGEDFLSRSRPLLFGEPIDSVRADVFAMKQRTEAFLQQKGRIRGDVKLGEGSIRDVEFCVQFLQLAHGAERPEILSHNTLEGLANCFRAGLLTLDEYRVLMDGYVFLRTIEHHLQMMDYRQTHTLPDDPEAIAQLARRLGFGLNGGSNGGPRASANAFLERYRQHAAAIREVYLRYVGSVEMKKTHLSRPEKGDSPSGNASPVSLDQHRARMSPSYLETFSEAEIARHATLANHLDAQRLVMVDGIPLDDGAWEVTIVAYDFPGELSLICGLMFVYGLDIVKGDVFTYEPGNGTHPALPEAQRSLSQDKNRKIVDVFTVKPTGETQVTPETWMRYAQDLEDLLRLVRAGQRREARGELAKRVANTLYEAHHPQSGEARPLDEALETPHPQPEIAPLLYPVEIQFDNESSDRYTVLHIDTPDTTGFLYEITNALAIYRVYIARVTVSTVGSRVRDTLFVTDENGQKITGADRQRELRAAVVLIKHFTHLLPYSPNPESALLHFREFIGQLFKRPNWPDELGSLERPEVLHALARLLGVSDFLWDDFLRMQYVNLYPVVRDVDALESAKSCETLEAELAAILKDAPDESRAWQERLNDFKDREMFRIDMRHILGHTREFWDFAAELTALAEVVVSAAFRMCFADLKAQYGEPLLDNGAPSVMSVVALGKCGGREMGFASDVELMFIYSGNGKTSGGPNGASISSTEFYEKLVTAYVRAIRARREGVFEIDLQLRPYGKAGSLSVSLDAFRRYFAPQGPAWAYERQALVKLRPIAGDEALGQQITALRDEFVYTGEPFDVTAMRAMRERQIRHLVTGGMFNLKYSPGGLVDVEYLVQALQITHGKARPELRLTNTREAMAALAAAGILSEEDYTRLRKAHTFLRWMIDSLRVVRGNAKDVTVPPDGSEEFGFLARRMPYGNDQARLKEALEKYTQDAQELNRRLLGW